MSMRVEPYTIGSYLHVVKRGARGGKIVRDTADSWRFIKMMFLLNDRSFSNDWFFTKGENNIFSRPNHWEPREPIVDILAYTLMPNHFHIILREIVDGGVTLFMKRLGQSMTNYSNEKYQEMGSLFQGAYRSRTIADDDYLRYVSAYVMVKNTLELYPGGGLVAAKEDFQTAWEWSVNHQFSSLGEFMQKREKTPITSPGLLNELFIPEVFEVYARDMILGGKWAEGENKLE